MDSFTTEAPLCSQSVAPLCTNVPEAVVPKAVSVLAMVMPSSNSVRPVYVLLP